jgi:hypothetical protein
MLFGLDVSDSDVNGKAGSAKFRLIVVVLTGSEQEKIILEARA